MGETKAGGRYRTAQGKLVDAHGRPLDEKQTAAVAAPSPAPTTTAVTEVTEVDDLTVIVGIGHTTQERLNEAGIYSYAELVTAEPHQIGQATRANPSTIKSWQGDALALSNGPPHADDLTEIVGIGPARARELELKGIMTFKALAQADPEWLQETMHASYEQIGQWQNRAGELMNA
jgi:predicted flap endonuclease-1-like 5' DNA nuclease